MRKCRVVWSDFEIFFFFCQWIIRIKFPKRASTEVPTRSGEPIFYHAWSSVCSFCRFGVYRKIKKDKKIIILESIPTLFVAPESKKKKTNTRVFVVPTTSAPRSERVTPERVRAAPIKAPENVDKFIKYLTFRAFIYCRVNDRGCCLNARAAAKTCFSCTLRRL